MDMMFQPFMENRPLDMCLLFQLYTLPIVSFFFAKFINFNILYKNAVFFLFFVFFFCFFFYFFFFFLFFLFFLVCVFFLSFLRFSTK